MWRQSHGQSHIKGSINTESPSTIHPSASAAHPVSGSASGPPVVAHTLQQRTQQSRKRGEGSSSSANLVVVVDVGDGGGGGGGGTWTTADGGAVEHSEGHSTKQCDVGPCSRCATRNSWKEACVHGSVRGSSVSLLGACDACQWAIGSPPHTSGRGAALRMRLLSHLCVAAIQ